MKTIQVISLDGRPAALIAGDKAIISDRVTSRDRLRVQAKAHFALRVLAGELPEVPADGLRIGAPLGRPGKIICIGLNYSEHREETGMGKGHTYPTIFPRWADTQVGHLQPLIRPRDSDNFDYEGELALVIGRRGHRINRDGTLDHVAG